MGWEYRHLPSPVFLVCDLACLRLAWETNSLTGARHENVETAWRAGEGNRTQQTEVV